MKKILSLFLITICSIYLPAQTAEGGGAYIQGNGKLLNCIITKNYATNGFGVSGSEGEVINSTIEGNLYLSKEIIAPGDIVLNDGTIYTPQYDNSGALVFPTGYNASSVTGVCFWSNINNDYLNAKAWIIAVTESPTSWSPTLNNNTPNITLLHNYNNPGVVDIDKDGVGNTLAIISFPGFVENPSAGSYAITILNCAAKYCYQYGSVPGIWFLPALGQLQELFRTLNTVNHILTQLQKTTISASEYWSSTEISDQGAWKYNLATGAVSYSPKTTALKVRAMREISRSN